MSTTAPCQNAAPAADPVAPARVLRQFRVLFNAVRGHFRAVERAAGIGGAQLWALSEIGGSPGLGLGDLAAALDIHQSTASNLVRALLERGLIVQARRQDDRRAVALTVSDAGLALLDRAPPPFRGVLPTALGELDPAVLARLEEDLHVLIGLLETGDQGAQTPLAEL
ncbi:MarR family winged helix-turn-helix transcriptional regulator [Pseudoduganella sp. UC29_71]|uniref:MarR family winged helix-turn-helix transcriptional regulator n=1 Tax=Pseudoduganella sp. UC29_71 TaxID=3350174 RepID=UPI00366B5C87